MAGVREPDPPGGGNVSKSVKGIGKAAGIAIVAMLCFALLLGVVACGGEKTTETTVEVTTTAVEQTETTVAETMTSTVSGSIDEALLGKWFSEETGETLEFTAEGKMLVTSEAQEGVVEFVYSADGTTATVSDGANEFPTAYSVEGDTLTMTDPEVGAPVTYQRVAE
jgi:hypothetical protein